MKYFIRKIINKAREKTESGSLCLYLINWQLSRFVWSSSSIFAASHFRSCSTGKSLGM